MVDRQPVPGPGLAIRIPGEITAERLTVLRNADRVYLGEIRKSDLYNWIWQASAVPLPSYVEAAGDDRVGVRE